MNHGNQSKIIYQLKYNLYIDLMNLDKYIHSDVENKIYSYWKKMNFLNQKKIQKNSQQ